MNTPNNPLNDNLDALLALVPAIREARLEYGVDWIARPYAIAHNAPDVDESIDTLLAIAAACTELNASRERWRSLAHDVVFQTPNRSELEAEVERLRDENATLKARVAKLEDDLTDEANRDF